ncbi:hypothetical protein [uncultured Mycobacterium sp.]|uniref:hypothetical protein n=1 Tax=uncultured Mycobacterium sp. TaxID=171292 RepID=UPI0035C97B5B
MIENAMGDHAVGGVARPYQLWTQARSWCDYEIDVEKGYKPAIRSLFPNDWGGEGQEITPTVELIPEPDSPRGMSAISVRTRGRTIGYLKDEDAPAWAGVIRRIVASGFIPTTSSRIWAYEYDGWDGIEFNADVRIALGKPNEALPVNEPPAVPYTMLPRSSIVQVTKEDEHTAALLKFVPEGGYGVLFVTLHECPSQGRAKPHVEVRIDDERVGQLTPQMSQRFLPLVEHLEDRGLVTACWGDITGSPVAAEVRIDAVKANEATPELLDGPPVTIPALTPELSDPLRYDLTAMRSYLRPTMFQPAPPRMAPEPPDGSLVRFVKSRRYNYVAVRRGNHWETTASTNLGPISQVMSWSDLAARVRAFEIATAWDWVTDARNDPRVREYLAVVRFTIAGLYFAAINVCDESSEAGNWYTTITDELSERLPIGNIARWSEITRYGEYIQVVTAWAQAL